MPAAATVVLVIVSAALTAHRDLGAGLVAARPGPASAAPSLGRPLGLAVRLQRGTLVAWTLGLLLLGFVYGSIADDVGDLVGDNHTLKQLMAGTGGASLTDAYFGTALLILALITSGFAISAVQRLHGEEASGYAETLLAAPVSRLAWVASHLAVVLGGSALVLGAAGLGAGVPYAFETRRFHPVPTLLGAALVHLPAVWLLAGVAVALYGLAPRAMAVSWAVLAGCFVIGFFGPLWKLPSWVLDLSPFEHTPDLPAAMLTVVPLVVLVAATAGLIGLGLVGFRHRDVG